MKLSSLLIALSLFAVGCTTTVQLTEEERHGHPHQPATPLQALTPEEIVWSGEVVVDETLTLPRGSKITIEPGTVVRFKELDEDGDGWGDISIKLEGELISRGTAARPIRFTTLKPVPTPGSWGELRIDFGKVDVSHTIFEGSTRGLHLHFTGGRVADSLFRDNVDGTRLGESRLEFSRCLFTNNEGKGFNARASTIGLTGSWFRDNRKGIFLFEGDKGSTISGNLFTGNDTPVRLGDFYEGTVSFSGNWWEKPPLDYRAEGNVEAELVTAPAEGSPSGIGPFGWPLLKQVWARELEGYVDADPVADDLGVFFADWGGNVKRLGFLDGNEASSTKLGDTVDARLALGRLGNKSFAAALSWDRAVTLMNAFTLEVLDSFEEPPSPADDHRQSAPLIIGDRLYAATWGGNVRAFEIGNGKLTPLWIFNAGSPFRGALARSVAGHLLAPNSNGTLYALEAETGKLAWTHESSDPLLSSPATATLSKGAEEQAEETILIADRAGVLRALRVGGAPRWQRKLCGQVWYAPALIIGQDSMAVQGDDAGCLTAVTIEAGDEVWQTAMDGGIRSATVEVGGALAVTTLGGSLYLLDSESGLVLDRLDHDEPLHTAPAIQGSRLFYGGRDGFARSADVTVHEVP